MLTIDLTNKSTITAVKPPQPSTVSIEEQEKQVEEYLISLCQQLQDKQAETNQSQVATENDMRVFSEFARETEVVRSMDVSDLMKSILVKDNIFEEWISTDFFRLVISDPTILREVLLSNPLIIQLIMINPGLQEFFEDEKNIRDLINIVFFSDEKEILVKNEKVKKIVEERIGRKLEFTAEYVSFGIRCYKVVKPIKNNTNEQKSRSDWFGEYQSSIKTKLTKRKCSGNGYKAYFNVFRN